MAALKAVLEEIQKELKPSRRSKNDGLHPGRGTASIGLVSTLISILERINSLDSDYQQVSLRSEFNSMMCMFLYLIFEYCCVGCCNNAIISIELIPLDLGSFDEKSF